VRASQSGWEHRSIANAGAIRIQYSKSWMNYLAFLGSMLTPAIGQLALPGGAASLLDDIYAADAASKLVIVSLLAVDLAVAGFLSQRIFHLLRQA